MVGVVAGITGHPDVAGEDRALEEGRVALIDARLAAGEAAEERDALCEVEGRAARVPEIELLGRPVGAGGDPDLVASEADIEGGLQGDEGLAPALAVTAWRGGVHEPDGLGAAERGEGDEREDGQQA